MATTEQLIADAVKALRNPTGFHRPHPEQSAEAHARATIALASAMDRVADALETLAANTAPHTDVQPAIRHSA